MYRISIWDSIIGGNVVAEFSTSGLTYCEAEFVAHAMRRKMTIDTGKEFYISVNEEE